MLWVRIHMTIAESSSEPAWEDKTKQLETDGKEGCFFVCFLLFCLFCFVFARRENIDQSVSLVSISFCKEVKEYLCFLIENSRIF